MSDGEQHLYNHEFLFGCHHHSRQSMRSSYSTGPNWDSSARYKLGLLPSIACFLQRPALFDTCPWFPLLRLQCLERIRSDLTKFPANVKYYVADISHPENDDENMLTWETCQPFFRFMGKPTFCSLGQNKNLSQTNSVLIWRCGLTPNSSYRKWQYLTPRHCRSNRGFGFGYRYHRWQYKRSSPSRIPIPNPSGRVQLKNPIQLSWRPFWF